MEKEIELLSRLAANHLLLGQFEPLRATLLSLRKRNPELAFSFLRKIVSEGGNVDGVQWSSTCSSPSLLAWLSVLELLKFDSNSSISSFDPENLRLRVEFLLLVQLVSSRAPESADFLNKILQSGLRRLKSDADMISPVTDEELKSLWEVYLGHAEIFDAICVNIQRQLQLPESEGDESEVLIRIQQSVQMAHLDALREKSNGGDLDGALSHLRFLHQDYGIDGSEYK